MISTRTLAIAVTSAFAVQAAWANDFLASTDMIGYTGSVSVYDTLADAQNETNARSGPHAWDQRSAGLYFAGGSHPSAAGFENANIFLTAWWYTTSDNTNGYAKDDPLGDRLYSGWGNPENTNTGFVQLYDGDGSTTTSKSASWSTLNPGVVDGSVFTLLASGTNAPYAEDFSRLWHAPNVGGAGALTSGTFVEWDMELVASGLTANWDGTYMTSLDHPDSVSGHFRGIFENQSTTDSSVHGFYRFDLTFNDTVWAVTQGNEALNGNLSDSYFSTVPEPGTLTVLALGALALRRRRK